MKARLISPFVVLALTLVGCGPTVIPVACGPQARMPVPVSRGDMARLQGIADMITAEAIGGESTPDITLVDADETTGTVVVGSSHPTLQLCDTLHTRYGPLVEVIYQEPAHLL